MTEAGLDRYRARMRRALDYIDAHLDAELDLDTLSGVAAFSKHHFHRQFGAFFGVSVHRYIQLARIKRAAYRLVFRSQLSVTEIALDAGYAAPEAFARAFRARTGQSPSVFRNTPAWTDWQARFQPLAYARSRLMHTFSIADVTIRQQPSIAVLTLEHHGDPARIGETIRRFIDFRKAHGLNPQRNATYTVFHSDPRHTPAADFRMDLCVAADPGLASAADGMRADRIPGGRCAVLRVTGASDDLEPAALFLYRDWLPASGEEPGDFPLYAERVRFFPDVPEHQAITDLSLPLK